MTESKRKPGQHSVMIHPPSGEVAIFDEAMRRLLGFDRRRYWLSNGWSIKFRVADQLICDFFGAVEQACRQEGVPFEFEADDADLEVEENDDGTQVTG